jgi:hypothetical protein
MGKYSKYRLAKYILKILGLFFLVLSVCFPVWMNLLREHGGNEVSVVYSPGTESLKQALDSVATILSIVSSIGVASVIILFERSINRSAGVSSLILGTVTLGIYSFEILLTLCLSLLRPLTGSNPCLIQMDILLGLIPLGLGFTMFTLASTLPTSVE